MANELAIELAQNKDTYRDCRIFLKDVLGSVDKVVQVENAPINASIPYYIMYIERREVSMMEALEYYSDDMPNADFWDLLKTTIKGVFNKMEKNEVHFLPF